MTDTPALLAATMIAGFALLALAVVAFAAHRPRAGLTMLVLACAACVCCYPLMGSLARAQQDQTRAAIEAKYGIEVTRWGEPFESSKVWVIDGQQRICDRIDLSDRDDPILECRALQPGEPLGGH